MARPAKTDTATQPSKGVVQPAAREDDAAPNLEPPEDDLFDGQREPFGGGTSGWGGATTPQWRQSKQHAIWANGPPHLMMAGGVLPSSKLSEP